MDRHRMFCNDRLPPPPQSFYALVDEARAAGMWLHFSRDSYHQTEQGGRYRLSRNGSRSPLLVTDDLDQIRAYLWTVT